MSVDTDVQMQQADQQESAVQPPQAAADDLQDSLSDPLAESADESVQMVVPPKPGAGPKVTDSFVPIEEILAEESEAETNSG